MKYFENYFRYYDEDMVRTVSEIPLADQIQVSCMIHDNWMEIVKCVGLWNMGTSLFFIWF